MTNLPAGFIEVSDTDGVTHLVRASAIERVVKKGDPGRTDILFPGGGWIWAALSYDTVKALMAEALGRKG